MSDQASLSAREGNFDNPPASNQAEPNIGDIEARLSHVRSVLRRERQRLRPSSRADEAQRRLAAAAAEMPSSPDGRHRMRNVLRQLRENESAYRSAAEQANIPPPPLYSPADILRNRREAIAARGRRDNIRELQEASERLAQVNANLRNLIDQPFTEQPVAGRYSRRRPSSTMYDDSAEQPRRKRRRTEQSGNGEDQARIEYGYEGQVVPGRLRMKLVSSDGGMIGTNLPHRDLHRSYEAENVLRENDSVYCTQSSRCNMVLSHDGECIFNLERLVIKAPGRGFTDPVQEGLVFVSMNKDGVFDRTTKYHIHAAGGDFAPHFSSLWDDAEANERPHLVERRQSFQRDLRDVNLDCDTSSDSDAGEASIIAATSLRPAPPPGIASDGEDLESASSIASFDTSESTRPTHLQAPLQIGNFTLVGDVQPYLDAEVTRREEASESEAAHEGWAPPSARRRPRSLNLLPHPSAASALLQPTARFSMVTRARRRHRRRGAQEHNAGEKEDGTMTIKFDPPVSGRYILLKMWNPRRGGNIDVQSISAYGFAGVRWFPAMQVR